jgi:hypothetical protein
MGSQEVRQFDVWAGYNLAADGQVSHWAQLEFAKTDLAHPDDEPSQIVFAAGYRVLNQIRATLGAWGPNWAARAMAASDQAARNWVSTQVHALLEVYDDAPVCLMGWAIIARSSRGHLLAMERGEVVESASREINSARGIHFEDGPHDPESAPNEAEIEATLRDISAACLGLLDPQFAH